MGSGQRRSTSSSWTLPRNLEQATSGGCSPPTSPSESATSAGKLIYDEAQLPFNDHSIKCYDRIYHLERCQALLTAQLQVPFDQVNRKHTHCSIYSELFVLSVQRLLQGRDPAAGPDL